MNNTHSPNLNYAIKFFFNTKNKQNFVMKQIANKPRQQKKLIDLYTKQMQQIKKYVNTLYIENQRNAVIRGVRAHPKSALHLASRYKQLTSPNATVRSSFHSPHTPRKRKRSTNAA